MSLLFSRLLVVVRSFPPYSVHTLFTMPSSSLFLRSSSTLVTALALLSVSSAIPVTTPVATTSKSYSLDTEYSGSSFFDGFNFLSTFDPTHGFVDFLSRSDAESNKLLSYGPNAPAKMFVDSSTPLPPPANQDVYWEKDGVGRKSVRLESSKRWTHGLIVLDLTHMPTSSTDGCGTWPAFWTLGSGTWPYNGEIDIIEGANDQTKNFAAGHTGSADHNRQCSISNSGGSGLVTSSNCNLYDSTGTASNFVGCKIEDQTAKAYGKPFNDNKGGVYAMEWTSDYIKTFFFPRGSIPSDVGSSKPDPTKWTPYAVFASTCNIDNNFKDMQIIFDTTFCGDFGDATWATKCAAKTGFDTCAKYVASKPGDFTEAYWEVNSLKVFTLKDTASSTTTTTTTSTWSTTTSAITTVSFQACFLCISADSL